MNEVDRPRIFKFDTVKLLVVVLVVVGSFAEEFTDRSDMFRSWFIFVNSFTAPLYIFLSGLFQKQFQKGQRPNLHKISFYLILGYILKITIFLLRRWNGEDVGLDMFGGATIEWYFFVIVMYTVTVWLLKGVHRYILLIGSVILGVVAGFLPLSDEFYLMRYFVFLPFYVAGYNLTPARVRRFSHKVNVKLAGAAFLIIYFVLCFREREIIYPLRMLFTGRNAYAIVPIEGCTFYHRMLCYGISGGHDHLHHRLYPQPQGTDPHAHGAQHAGRSVLALSIGTAPVARRRVRSAAAAGRSAVEDHGADDRGDRRADFSGQDLQLAAE